MIKAEWTNNDALSTGQTTYSNAHNTLNALDCVSRQYAIEHYQHVCRRTACKECPLHIQVTDTFTDCELELFLHNLPSAQPDITDEQAIEHLQKSGWMQSHDKQMYEAGLRERLADDSGSYDALLPSAQPEYTEQDVRDSFNSGYACGMEAAQSEIVRCENCAWWQRDWSDEKDYHYCTMEDDRTYKEFYCANAERREE